MFICEGNSTVSLTETHLRRLVFTRALGRGAGSPKASPRSLTPGFSDQPLASLAAEGAQTLALWEQHSFSTFFFSPLQTSPKPRRAAGWRRPTSGDGDGAPRTPGPAAAPHSPVSVLERHHGPQPRSLGSACPLFGGSLPGNGAVAPRRPTGTPRKRRARALSGSCWRKGKAGRL